MKTKAFIYIVLAGLLWGTSGIFVKFLTPYGFKATELSLIRGTISFLAMLIYALIFDRNILKIGTPNLIYAALIGITLYGTATLYYSSMQLTSVSTAVVLMYTAPIYVTIVSVAFLGEKTCKLKNASIGMMLVGCALVSGVVGGMKFDTVGIVLGILSGIVYATYNILTKITLKHSANAITLSLYGFLFMALTALITARPSKIIENAKAEPILTIPLMLGLGIFTFVLPYFFYTLSMRDLPAGTASALSIIEPLAATLLSAIVFGEIPSLISSVGIVFIVIATYMLGRSENISVNNSVSHECDKAGFSQNVPVNKKRKNDTQQK